MVALCYFDFVQNVSDILADDCFILLSANHSIYG